MLQVEVNKKQGEEKRLDDSIYLFFYLASALVVSRMKARPSLEGGKVRGIEYRADGRGRQTVGRQRSVIAEEGRGGEISRGTRRHVGLNEMTALVLWANCAFI